MTANRALAGAQWRKSSRSQGASACVEVALTTTAVGVRDTKNLKAGHLTVTPAAWAAFTMTVRTGLLDQ